MTDSDFTLPDIKITGRATHDGMPWYKVCVAGKDGNSCLVSADQLDCGAQPVIDIARSLGYAIATRRDRDKLLEKVGTAINTQRGQSLPLFKIASQIGWTTDLLTFVTPQQFYGRHVDVVGATDLGVPDHANYSRSDGSLRDWQDAFRRVLRKNPLFVFGACLALMPPLLALTGRPGCMFVFTGYSSLGKTTLLDFIGSLRGGKPQPALGFQESFRATANYLENYGLSANDSVLVVDDIRSAPGDDKARAKLIGEAIYLLATGRQKGRLDGLGKPRSFRTVAVTSDNFSLRTLLANGGIEHDPSMDVRLIQIAIPSGKGVIDQQDLTREQRSDQINTIRGASHRHYGFPLHKFLKRLLEAQNEDQEALRSTLKARIDRQVKRLLPGGGENTTGRTADYFGLAYAAGCFAIKNGILPVTKGQLRDAVAFAYEMHLVAHSGAEAADPISQLRAILEEGLERLVVLPVNDRNQHEAAIGFSRKLEGGDEFLFTKVQFDRLLPAGMIRSRMCDALHRRGLLNRDVGSSKATVKNTKKVRIGKHRERVYCISARILASDR